MSQSLNPKTVRPASGERLSAARTTGGVGTTWEKRRRRRSAMERGSESGSLTSSEERERAI